MVSLRWRKRKRETENAEAVTRAWGEGYRGDRGVRAIAATACRPTRPSRAFRRTALPTFRRGGRGSWASVVSPQAFCLGDSLQCDSVGCRPPRNPILLSQVTDGLVRCAHLAMQFPVDLLQ